MDVATLDMYRRAEYPDSFGPVTDDSLRRFLGYGQRIRYGLERADVELSRSNNCVSAKMDACNFVQSNRYRLTPFPSNASRMQLSRNDLPQWAAPHIEKMAMSVSISSRIDDASSLISNLSSPWLSFCTLINCTGGSNSRAPYVSIASGS